jgi:hypothetical protein
MVAVAERRCRMMMMAMAAPQRRRTAGMRMAHTRPILAALR